jgi:uncharacterized protein
MPHFSIKVFIIAFLIGLPPLLRCLGKLRSVTRDPAHWRERVVSRYLVTSTYTWLFAYWKLRLDPLCGELCAFLQRRERVRAALDVGCGYGVPGCSLLERFPDAMIFGIDPTADRVKVASVVFGQRGVARVKSAPNIDDPEFPPKFDVVIMLDMIHYLPEESFDLTLRQIHGKLHPGGHLLMRIVSPPAGSGSLSWKIDVLKRKISRSTVYFRSVEHIRTKLEVLGFDVEECGISSGISEMVWFVARVG